MFAKGHGAPHDHHVFPQAVSNQLGAKKVDSHWQQEPQAMLLVGHPVRLLLLTKGQTYQESLQRVCQPSGLNWRDSDTARLQGSGPHEPGWAPTHWQTHGFRMPDGVWWAGDPPHRTWPFSPTTLLPLLPGSCSTHDSSRLQPAGASAASVISCSGTTARPTCSGWPTNSLRDEVGMGASRKGDKTSRG